jgi:hypothetical protein
MNIFLNGNTLAETDIKEALVLPLDSLKLAFSSSVYRLSPLIVGVYDGEKTKQYKIKAPFELDLSEFIKPGAIEITVSMTINTTVVKEWRVPTIYIKQIEQSFVATDEIIELREKLTETRKALSELTEILKNNNLI